MKILQPLFLILVLIFCLESCQTGGSNNSGEGKKPKLIEADFYGGCYHTGTANFEELLNITVDQGELSGTGIRLNNKMNDRFQLNISGKQNENGSFDVEISATSMRSKNVETTYEAWTIGEKRLDVKNRSTANFIGDLSFYKINCEASVEKDSSLYDGFFGFFEEHAVVLKDGKYGLVNKDWELTIPCKYRSLGVVNEGAIVYYNDTLNRHGVLDTEGNIMIKPIFDQVSGFSEGLCAVLDNGKWGFVDKKGKVIIPPKYFMINYYQPIPSTTAFNEGLANVAIADAEWGYINPKGEVVIPYQFMFAEAFKNGKAKVMRKGESKWVYIDKNGTCIEGCN